MTAIEIDNATIAIGGRTVLSDISLSIGAGAFVGLLGANGAGKTTLIKAILGLLKPVAGTIAVLGEPARRGNPQIGYLPQTRSALSGFRVTGREFLASAIDGHRFGLPFLSAEGALEVDECLALVAGGDLAGRSLSDLSGGERQRLLIAGALIGRPRLLLLDEPLISLDPYQQHVIVELIGRLSRELKLTVLFSAHELNQLLGAIDEVLYLGRGQAALGPVDEVMTAEVLSRLYGSEIEVVRASGHIFVMSRGLEVERGHHQHDHNHGHDHAHP